MGRQKRFSKRVRTRLRQSPPASTPSGRRLRLEALEARRLLAYQDLVLADDPIGYWRLEESAGATAADSSPTGNLATYSATVEQGVAGAPLLGAAAGFDDVGDTQLDRIELLQPVPIGATSSTIEAWIKIDPALLADEARPGAIFANYAEAGTPFLNVVVQSNNASGASYYGAAANSNMPAFDSATASFTHTAIPEAGSLLFVTLAASGVALVAAVKRLAQSRC